MHSMKSFYSRGQPLDDVVEYFLKEADEAFKKLEKKATWDYLTEQKRKVIDAIRYIAAEKKFLDY